MAADDTRTLANRAVDALNRKDLDAVATLFAPDAKWHGMMSPEPVDNAGYRATMAGLFAAFPDARFVVDDLIVDGGKAAIRHTLRGTQREAFMGIPATGRTIVIPAVFVFHSANGQITEGWLNADALGMMNQLTAAS